MCRGIAARRTVSRWLVAAVALFGAGRTAAQQEPPSPRAFPAVERWLATDQTARDGLETAVRELLADPAAGLAWLGAELRRDAARERKKGLDSLTADVALEFLSRQRRSGVRFAGQFEPLRPLQPQVGEYLFGLLLDTPQWYPNSHRDRLVPALRDLQPKSPGEPIVGRVLTIVENVAIEPEPLRLALAGMLWQWGMQEHAQRHVDALVQQSSEGDAEDRVRVLLELAEFWYELREYRNAAGTHRSLQAMAKSAKLQLKPIDWYQAACNHALCGDLERAFAALRQCAALQSSPAIDVSHRLERSLFETDPELASLRGDPRFAAILQQAFPGESEPATGR